MKWIDILQVETDTKTSRFLVRTADHAIELGEIRFYPRWRKYAFYPASNALFECDCLRDIANCCEAETKSWRGSLRRAERQQA